MDDVDVFVLEKLTKFVERGAECHVFIFELVIQAIWFFPEEKGRFRKV